MIIKVYKCDKCNELIDNSIKFTLNSKKERKIFDDGYNEKWSYIPIDVDLCEKCTIMFLQHYFKQDYENFLKIKDI